jgi:hypothetical protein
MKAFEFQTSLCSPNTLPIPSEVASQLQAEQTVRVLLLVSEGDEDADWARLTSEQFLEGYHPDDSAYDQLQAR